MNPGNAILFVCSLVLWAMLLAYTMMYALHCYLVVVQGTVADIDRVEWPNEPILDWLLGSIPTLAMMALWLIPAGLLSRALATELPTLIAPARFFLIAMPFLWLFLPLGLLSSMAASSPWIPLTPGVVIGLIRLTPFAALFYLVTAGLLAATAGLGYVALFSNEWYFVPVAAVVGSACMLIHARLVGRLGWLLQRLYTPPDERPVKGGKRKKKASRPRAEADTEAMDEDDESISPVPAPRKAKKRKERAEAMSGYEVVEQPVEKKAPRPAYLDPEPDPYTLADGEVELAPVTPSVRDRDEIDKQVEREIELRERRPPNPPPEWPLFSGVYNFPIYPTSQKAWLWLGMWGMATGFACRLMLQFLPS